MTDRRERILQRVLAIMESIEDLKTVTRNEIEFDDTQLPSMSLLEGDEEVNLDNDNSGRPALVPVMVTATPQVFIKAKSTDDVGTALNELRATLISAVCSDDELRAEVGRGGRIRYAGMQSQLHAARAMIGVTVPVFAITYLLDPGNP